MAGRPSSAASAARPSLARCVDGREADGGDAGGVQEGLLLQPVLGDGQRPGAGGHRRAQPLQLSHGGGGDVLELEGDHLGELRQGAQGGQIVVGGDDRVGRHPRGWGIRLRRQDRGIEAQASGRHRQHAAQLPPAEDADRCARRKRKGRHPSAWSSTESGTAWVWRRR
jgi:hypothetical protein